MRLSDAGFGATLLLLVACGSSAVVRDGAAGGSSQGGSAAGAAGGAGGGLGQGGDIGFGGFGGAGGVAQQPWEHDCEPTGIAVEGVGPPALFDEVCPDDFWAATHHDGAVAYHVAAGFVGSLDFHACAQGGTRQIHLSAHVDGASTVSVVGGRYVDGDQMFDLTSGDLTVVVDGDVGELVVGSYTATFAPSGGGEPQVLGGDLAACHLPVLPAP